MEVENLIEFVDRKDSPSIKHNKAAIKNICNNENAKPFWVADMDFKAPLAIREALIKEAKHGVFGYSRFDEVEEVYLKWAKEWHSWPIDKSLLIPFPGMLSSIALLIELYSKEGDSIILPMPAYNPFIRIIKALKRKIVYWPLAYDAQKAYFSFDCHLLEKLAKENKNSILLFCSPHNPTGRVFSRIELESVAQIAKTNNLVIISDEIHGDLKHPSFVHTPFDVLAKEYDLRCATCVSPSKTFNIAGEHFSYIICSDKAMYNKVAARQRALNLRPSLLATTMALAAYKEGKDFLLTLIDYLLNNSLLLQKQLEDSPLKVVKAEASFITMIDCSDVVELALNDFKANPSLYDPTLSPDGGLLSRFFGLRASVAMNDGSWFGKEYSNFVRFNFATDYELVKWAAQAMKAATTN